MDLNFALSSLEEIDKSLSNCQLQLSHETRVNSDLKRERLTSSKDLDFAKMTLNKAESRLFTCKMDLGRLKKTSDSFKPLNRECLDLIYQREKEIIKINQELLEAREIVSERQKLDDEVNDKVEKSNSILESLAKEAADFNHQKKTFLKTTPDIILFKLTLIRSDTMAEVHERCLDEAESYVIHNSTLRSYDRIPSFELLSSKKKLFKATSTTKFTFISHKWYDSGPDDEDRSLLIYIQGLPDGFYWVDYCCIAQEDPVRKMAMLRSIPRLISSKVLVYPNNSDYQKSVWCAFETLNQPGDSMTLWDELTPLKCLDDAGPMSLSLILSKDSIVRTKLIEYFKKSF